MWKRIVDNKKQTIAALAIIFVPGAIPVALSVLAIKNRKNISNIVKKSVALFKKSDTIK